jgi:hypothetical protein
VSFAAIARKLDLLGRVVVVREALADGAIGYAAHLLEDLEVDVAGAIHRDDDVRRLREARDLLLRLSSEAEAA